MGNTASSIANTVSGLTSEALEKDLEDDLKILSDHRQFFNHAALFKGEELKYYQIPGMVPSDSNKTEDLNYVNEVKMLIDIENKEFIKERHSKVSQDLLKEIGLNRGEEESSIEATKKLQTLFRIYEALLRMDEREKRKLNLVISFKDDELSPAVWSGLSFSLSSLFSLIKVVGADKPVLYKLIIENISNIVSRLSAMNLDSYDPLENEIVSSITSFFNSLLREEAQNIQIEDLSAWYSILFDLYYATGQLSIALTLALAFSFLDSTKNYSKLYKNVFSRIIKFKELTSPSKSKATFKWDDSKIQGKGIEIVHEEPGLLNKWLYEDWALGLSLETYSSGIHYFEMTYIESYDNVVEFGISSEDMLGYNESSTIAYFSRGGVWKKGVWLHNFEIFNAGDKIGILLDMNKNNVLFYHNGKPDPKGFIKLFSWRVKVYIETGDIGKYKVEVNPKNIPDDVLILTGWKKETEEEDLGSIDNAVEDGEITDKYLQIKPIELSRYIIKTLGYQTEVILKFLDKNMKLENNPGPNLDVKNETIEILENLILSCTEKIHSQSVDKESKEIYSEMLVYVLKISRAHLIGFGIFSHVKLERELGNRTMKCISDIITNMPETKACEEAAKIIWSCFSAFYMDPQEKLSYLLDRLKDQIDGIEVSIIFKEIENRIFLEMARPDKLFPILKLINNESQNLIETYFKYLVEFSSKVSKKIINGEETSVEKIKLLESSQIALFCQAAKSGFKGKWQEILINYSLIVLQNCEEILLLIREKETGPILSDELINNIRKTILADLLETLFYMLSLAFLNLDSLAKILPMLQNIIIELHRFDLKPKILSQGWTLSAGEVIESSHPYGDPFIESHTIRIPGARKYYLTFDQNCWLGSWNNRLTLWKNDKEDEPFLIWYQGFPQKWEKIEINLPYLHFTSFLDSSDSKYWGFKIDIIGEVPTDYYIKQWPEATKDAAENLFRSICVKLIKGEFESIFEDEKVKDFLQNPLFKNGISDKILKNTSPIPEGIITLIEMLKIEANDTANISDDFASNDSTIKTLDNNEEGLGIQEYINEYKNLRGLKYSEDQFINDFIEGNSEIIKYWNELKIVAGINDESLSIQGQCFDKAERAIFSVWIVIFEFEEIFKSLLEDPTKAGSTIIYLVQETARLRKLANSHFQKLKHTIWINFEDFSKDIILKCALIINSKYTQSLEELGINKTMKHLTTEITQTSALDVNFTSEPEINENEEKNISEDIKEIKKISEMLLSALESPVTADKIFSTIEKRRVKAMARILGFSNLQNSISLSNKKETGLIRSLIHSLSQNNAKLHYWDSLEGIDSNLLKCVQKSFYNIYGYLLKELLISKTIGVKSDNHSYYLTILDALCFPFKNCDDLMILEQPFSLVISLLLNWSKGYVGEIKNKSFLLDECITDLKIMLEAEISEDTEKVLLERRNEEGQNLYLIIERKGVIPIVDFQISAEEIEDYENIGEFTVDGESKNIFIQKSEPSKNNQFLININDNLECEYKSYKDLLKEESQNEKESRELLKDRLCKSAWAAYKFLIFTIVGNKNKNNSVAKQNVQELFLNAIFNELKWDQSLLDFDNSDMNLKGSVSGELWINKATEKWYKKNPMEEWIRQFNQETENFENSMLRNMVNDLVAGADPNMKGILTPEEISELDTEISELLLSQEDYLNSDGNFDFFKYINALFARKDELSEEDQSYIDNSALWANIPEDFEQAALCYDFRNIENILKNIILRFNPSGDENSFSQFLDLFEQEENKGIVPNEKIPEDCPEDFKNEEGDLDLYRALHTIIKDQDTYFDYYNELESVFLQYNKFPDSCLKIYMNENKQYVI